MQDAVSALPDAGAAADKPQPALPLRNDTILGVCEAIGEDFGFNPLWLRILFALSFYWNPLLVIGTYLGLGAGVALARWLYPVPAAAVPQLAASAAPQPADNEDSQASIAA